MSNLKKLMRGALEPARVFGRRDFDPKGGEALLHYQHNGDDYWSPGFPTWIVADGDCRVLERAIQRYGYREAPVAGGWQEFGDKLFNPIGFPAFELGELTDYELVQSGVVFPGFSVNGAVYPATPIAYAQRRWGDTLGEYRSDGDFLRVLVDGKVVVVVRSIENDRLKVWTTTAVNVKDDDSAAA